MIYNGFCVTLATKFSSKSKSDYDGRTEQEGAASSEGEFISRPTDERSFRSVVV